MILRFIGSLFLCVFVLSSLGEARQSKASHSRHLSAVRQKTKVGLKKGRESIGHRKRKTRASLAHRKQKTQAVPSNRQRQLRGIVAKKKQQVRTALSPKKNHLHSSRAKNNRHSRPTTTKTQHHHQAVAIRQKSSRILPIKKRRNHMPLPPLTYLSQLNAHNQENAKLGGIDQLYAKNLLGQGQAVAVIENPRTWEQIKNVMNKKEGTLSDETRERYKRNFLSPVSGPGLRPETVNRWMYLPKFDPYHGSTVASVVMDLAPQSKVLPVGTYASSLPNQEYDIANALQDLSKRSDVNIINLSGGHLENTLAREERGVNPDGTNKYYHKYVFSQKYIAAIKAIVKAGKVVVYATGNETEEVPGFEFEEKITLFHARFMSYLVENLDSETLKSIVFAGAFEPDTKQISTYSNRPGKKVPKAQDRFLFSPGKHQTSYSGTINSGTSISAPYICAAIANLASKPGVTPKKAVEALMETAEARPNEKHIYGRGLIRADRALEWLESRGF